MSGIIRKPFSLGLAMTIAYKGVAAVLAADA